MMQLAEGLRDRAWRQIEDQADPDALPRLRAALAQIADPQHQDAIFAAAVELAGAWADAGLLIGFRMAAEPGDWLFAEQD